LFNGGGVIGLGQSFGEMRMAKINAVKLFVQFREMACNASVPRATKIEKMIALFQPVPE
jgi:hypothetical protein